MGLDRSFLSGSHLSALPTSRSRLSRTLTLCGSEASQLVAVGFGLRPLALLPLFCVCKFVRPGPGPD